MGWCSGDFLGGLSCRCSGVPGSKPTTVSSEMKNKVWNVSLKSFVLKGLLKKFKGMGPGCGPGHTVLGRGGVLLVGTWDLQICLS